MATRENYIANKAHLKLISTEEETMVPTFEYPIGSAKGLQRVRNSFPCP